MKLRAVPHSLQLRKSVVQVWVRVLHSLVQVVPRLQLCSNTPLMLKGPAADYDAIQTHRLGRIEDSVEQPVKHHVSCPQANLAVNGRHTDRDGAQYGSEQGVDNQC